MKSRATADFWKCFEALPRSIQERARTAYARWSQNPYHRSLEFKRIKGSKHPLRSLRVGLHWRALGVERGDGMVWFWIGSHADYDRLISNPN